MKKCTIALLIIALMAPVFTNVIAQDAPDTMQAPDTSGQPGETAPLIEEPEPLNWEALPQPINKYTFDDYPAVDGSTATKPLSQALAYYLTGIKDMLTLELLADHTTTDNSYYMLAYDVADIILSYEASEETKAFLVEDAPSELHMQAIGRDALVFLINDDNPIDNLTRQQIIDIYSGKITNWKELGGADMEIAAFQRPENSGSQTMMQKLVMKDVKMAEAPSEYIAGEMGELISVVSSYANQGNAIGYSVYYYASKMYTQPGVKLIKIDDIAPDAATIGDASYPFINEFYAAINANAPKDSPGRFVFDIITSDIGMQIMEAMGYVGIADKKQ